MTKDRELDLVLFGATSFVGRLCAEYLSRAAPAELRVGLAGRSHERLGELRASLDGRAADWPLLIADTTDERSVGALVAATRVLATTVGPYRRYGPPVVEACARAGTHYADLTGEVLFMRETHERFDALAAKSGARIVHSCGFDSIPSDLGVLLLHEALMADATGQLEDTTLVVRALKGGASGGTVASLMGTTDDARSDPRLAAVLEDPYALSPDREAEPKLGPERELRGVQHDDELGMWVGPFIMGSINTRVVRRSNALQDWAYGPRFRYREVMGFGSGPMAAAQAGAVACGVGALTTGLSIGPVRSMLDRVLPSPGEGPNEKRREQGSFRIEIHARTSSGARYICRVPPRAIPATRRPPSCSARAVSLSPSTATGCRSVPGS